MLKSEFCLYCQQNPPWLKERETLKKKLQRRDTVVKEQDQQIKQLKELNWKLRKKGSNP